MKQTDKQREAFERWARVNLARLGGPFLRDCNDIEPEHTYQDPQTEFAWIVWQAATAQSSCPPYRFWQRRHALLFARRSTAD